jgi:hypothetical protein
MKIKRPQSAKLYRPEIDAMYAEIDAEDAKKPQKSML